MANRSKMPIPPGEMSPQALTARIRAWAEQVGYAFEQGTHASEFAKISVRDPAGGETTTIVPNAHQGPTPAGGSGAVYCAVS